MDKDYMLELIEERMKELTLRYKKTMDGTGNKGTATVQRARIKKDIQLCLLCKALLESTDDFYTEDEDVIDGFTKLVEPNEKKRGNKEQQGCN